MKFNQEGRRRAFHVLTVITKLACEAGSNTRIDTRHTSFFVSIDGQLQFDDAWRAASGTATGLGAVRRLLSKYDREEDERMALGMVNSSTLAGMLWQIARPCIESRHQKPSKNLAKTNKNALSIWFVFGSFLLRGWFVHESKTKQKPSKNPAKTHKHALSI